MNGNQIIIGLTGLAGSGKDTVRAMLEDAHGFTGLAFADPIRQMLRELLTSNCISTEWMDKRPLKEQPIPQLGVSYRHLAQTLGTEWGRQTVAPDLWLRMAAAYIDGIASETFAPPRFVISDVRFPNEADWVRSRGGVVWHIHRPGIEPVRAHASESSIEQIAVDHAINNSGTLDGLAAEVARAMAQATERTMTC